MKIYPIFCSNLCMLQADNQRKEEMLVIDFRLIWWLLKEPFSDLKPGKVNSIPFFGGYN